MRVSVNGLPAGQTEDSDTDWIMTVKGNPLDRIQANIIQYADGTSDIKSVQTFLKGEVTRLAFIY